MLHHVRKIDVEIHNECNRQCKWCPRSVVENAPAIHFPLDQYRKLLEDLVSLGFGKFKHPKLSSIFTFARYNEPTLYPEKLLEYVAIALEVLPANVRLELNTNGDHLTKEFVNQLNIDSLNIMDYDCKGREHWEDRFDELGIVIRKEAEHSIDGMTPKIKRVRCKFNWPERCAIEDRGGIIDLDSLANPKILNGQPRNMPCIEPLYMISIDSAGNVMPCYNMLSNWPNHKDYIVGNVIEEGIANIFNSDKMRSVRREIVSGDVDNFPSQCRRCNRIRPGHYEGIYSMESWTDPAKYAQRNIYMAKDEYKDVVELQED